MAEPDQQEVAKLKQEVQPAKLTTQAAIPAEIALDPRMLCPGHVIYWARRHCLIKRLFVGGRLMEEQFDRFFRYSRDSLTGRWDVWVSRDAKFETQAFSEEYCQSKPPPERRNDEFNFDWIETVEDDDFYTDISQDVDQLLANYSANEEKKAVDRKRRKENMPFQLQAMKSSLAEAAVQAAETQLKHHLRHSRKWTAGDWNNMLACVDRRAEERPDLMRVHYLIQELTHSLCHFNLKPTTAWTRVIRIKMIIEHPTKVNTHIDLYEHGWDHWDEWQAQLEEHRLFEGKDGKKMVGHGPYFWYPFNHGMKSEGRARKKLGKVINTNKDFHNFIFEAAEIDFKNRYWGRKPVAWLYRKSTLEAWAESEVAKLQTKPDGRSKGKQDAKLEAGRQQ